MYCRIECTSYTKQHWNDEWNNYFRKCIGPEATCLPRDVGEDSQAVSSPFVWNAMGRETWGRPSFLRSLQRHFVGKYNSKIAYKSKRILLINIINPRSPFMCYTATEISSTILWNKMYVMDKCYNLDFLFSGLLPAFLKNHKFEEVSIIYKYNIM